MKEEQSVNQQTQTVKAVKLMRQIREKLSVEYQDNPDQEARELESIRKQYHLEKSETHSST